MEERVYKIYAIRLRSKGSQALEETKTLTYSPEAALAGWRYAYDLPLSSEHILLLTHDGVKKAVHRYGSSPDDPEHQPRDIAIPQ